MEQYGVQEVAGKQDLITVILPRKDRVEIIIHFWQGSIFRL
jgi:hypothetical protein